jgi:DNA-binding transcriptional LysR family regulator
LNIEDLDLRALGYLEVLVEEGNVSKAALRLGMTQPGLSTALRRLRSVANDQLLVRTVRGMEPTACGLALVAEYGQIRERLRAILVSNTSFDHATAVRVFRVECLDYALATDVAEVIALLRAQAPGITLQTHAMSNRNFREHLESGYTDLLIGYLPELAEGLHISKLRQIPMSVIVSPSHPRLGTGMDLEAYLAGEHVGLMLGPDGVESYSDARLDAEFKARDRTRQVTVRVQSQFAIPSIVAKTDLIGMVPTELADKAARSEALTILPNPFADLEYSRSIAWHGRHDKDPAHRWLRQLFRTKRLRPPSRKPATLGAGFDQVFEAIGE